MIESAFLDHRQAALAALQRNHRLRRKDGSFLGQLAVDPSPLSKKQSDYLGDLLDRCGLPPFVGTCD
ncbi:hypothetical protein [Sphingobium sp. R-7]|uniref:hypothetical protein n=1 Tax=Sphingobium sp. R-7 TaxID=3375449 RepID=UPI00398AB050